MGLIFTLIILAIFLILVLIVFSAIGFWGLLGVVFIFALTYGGIHYLLYRFFEARQNR
jgi:hypothetical protein